MTAKPARFSQRAERERLLPPWIQFREADEASRWRQELLAGRAIFRG
jgi:hypothetical protein